MLLSGWEHTDTLRLEVAKIVKLREMDAIMTRNIAKVKQYMREGDKGGLEEQEELSWGMMYVAGAGWDVDGWSSDSEPEDFDIVEDRPACCGVPHDIPYLPPRGTVLPSTCPRTFRGYLAKGD